ncbi:hypothetical protein E2C01_025365 [Portunus trituberculatus]|uniref:Uncharacterized protein n=1 Tax=Portunus trituberculatus TaxID=210409 RepID=A0A5B7ED61_PORTR|nr:hypothetical protein [Portunus trituberculatus]
MAVAQTPSELLQPRCLTWHQQRQYINKYSSLWNALLTSGRGQPRAKKRKLEKSSLERWLTKEYKKCQNRQPELGEHMV